MRAVSAAGSYVQSRPVPLSEQKCKHFLKKSVPGVPLTCSDPEIYKIVRESLSVSGSPTQAHYTHSQTITKCMQTHIGSQRLA